MNNGDDGLLYMRCRPNRHKIRHQNRYSRFGAGGGRKLNPEMNTRFRFGPSTIRSNFFRARGDAKRLTDGKCAGG